MNTIDFLRESAWFLTEDRPDLYDHETAMEELDVAMTTLREEPDRQFSCIMFSSYAMMRLWMPDETGTEGVEEFILSRKLSSVIVFEAEEEVSAYTYHPDIELPSPLDNDYED